MARHEIDVLLLGREANARTVAHTRRLWLAGTRAFAPGCVVVREPPSVHVLANSGDAVPDGFPTDCLYGITWNPAKLWGRIAAIPGFDQARRVGVDGMTPMMCSFLATALPAAELVDAAPVLTDVRGLPDTERVAGVRAAAEVAAAGLTAMIEGLQPGVAARTVRSSCAAAFAGFGVTTPAFEAVVLRVDARASTWLSLDEPIAAHEPVLLRAGALREGWEASIARVYLPSGNRAVEQTPPPTWETMLGSCRPGARVGDLRARGAIIYGLGAGVEPWDDDYVLAAGLTCALEVQGPQSVRQDTLLLTETTAELLT
jgi:hypothetical protein